MKSYPHHIGDFDKATRHLTRIERSVYRDLIELYYTTESQLPLDIPKLCRLVLARSNDEVTAVEQALNEFFTVTPSGYYHDRCEYEIERYRTNSGQKALAGKASAAKRALKREQALNGCSTAVERTCNGTPTNHITLNHKPYNQIEKSAKAPAPKFTKPSLDDLQNEFNGRVHDPTREAQTFLSHYESNGWKVGRNPMKSWQHAVTNWITRGAQNAQHQRPVKPSRGEQHDQAMRDYFAELDREEEAAGHGVGRIAQSSFSV